MLSHTNNKTIMAMRLVPEDLGCIVYLNFVSLIALTWLTLLWGTTENVNTVEKYKKKCCEAKKFNNLLIIVLLNNILSAICALDHVLYIMY